jgi:SAM-dependent methyltransferase
VEFSGKYHEEAFPDRYANKHNESLSRRLNDWREQSLLSKCLNRIGSVRSVADIGCGPGRFWPTIANATRTEGSDLYGSDVSESMLRYARDRYARDRYARERYAGEGYENDGLGERFALASGSVTALPFADGAFDCVVSMRLLHHFGEPDVRLQAVRELARIADRYLIVSLWTDGNYKAWRRSRLERSRGERAYQNRFVVPRHELEAEFMACGLSPVAHFDLIPGYSQWRFYVLRKSSGAETARS